MIAELQTAYDHALPQVCEFLGPFDCAITDVPELFPETMYQFSVGPNPLTSSATLSFFLPEDRSASLRIYDATGRVLRTLVDQPLGAGPHAVIWDGRNDNGLPVASGRYWARIKLGDWKGTGKLLVTR